MNIKLLALDMDGTTLKDDHLTVSARNRQAIEAAIAKGIQVVTATGRMRHRLPAIVSELPAMRYAVTSNGASLVDLSNEQQLYRCLLPGGHAVRVLDALSDLDIYIEIYIGGHSYTGRIQDEALSRFPMPPERRPQMLRSRTVLEDLRAYAAGCGGAEKVNLPFLAPETRAEVLRRLTGWKELAITSSVPMNVEINAAACNKGAALEALCGHLGLDREQVMAIGDNGNDLEMLRFAGFSVAPENATEEAKAAADHITASNEEDGVALAIEAYLL